MSQNEVSFSEAQRDHMSRICAELALKAGVQIMRVRAAGAHVRYKSDASPVCEADEQAESVILAGLSEHFPDIPVIAEEAFARDGQTESSPAFFLVDALDGTKEFITGKDGFTVNIALIVQGAPVMGAVYSPAGQRVWFAGANAYATDVPLGAALPQPELWQKITVRPCPKSGMIAFSSSSHCEARALALLAELPIAIHQAYGSSLKFCRIAEGAGDIYPRFSPTMEWDTAAGDAILRAAGGGVLNESGQKLSYGRAGQGYRNPGFIALGDLKMQGAVTALMSRIC